MFELSDRCEPKYHRFLTRPCCIQPGLATRVLRLDANGRWAVPGIEMLPLTP